MSSIPTKLGYLFLISFSQYLGLGLKGVIAIQILCSALAAIAIYDLARTILDYRAGILALILFMYNPLIIRWNSFILTESLFISMVVISTWAINYASSSRRWTWYFISGLIVLYTASIRPHGWSLVPIACIYWIGGSGLTRKCKYFLIVLSATCLLVFSPFSKGIQYSFSIEGQRQSSILANYNQMQSEGMVVWGFSRWDLPMPIKRDSTVEEIGSRSIAHHPFWFIRLFCSRILVEFSHLRPFYSLRHNLFSIAFLLPLYFFAVWGAISLKRKPAVILVLIIIAAHIAFIGLTWADWDGRFLNYILPLISALASCGLVLSIDYYRSSQSRKP